MAEPASESILALLLKAVDEIKKVLYGQDDKKKLVQFKSPELNKRVGSFIINGDVNAPIIVVQQDEAISFGRVDNPIIKEKLEKGNKDTEVVESHFSEEYKDVLKHELRTEYSYLFIKNLDVKYKALIKASQYVKELYENGDQDIAQKRKEELVTDYESYGRKFCNLYTEDYIPEVLQYINEVKLVDKLAIQFLLDHIVNYNGILFVHQWTEEGDVIKKIRAFLVTNLNYIAIHGCGSNTKKVKQIKTAIETNISKKELEGYELKDKLTSKEESNKIKRHSIFIFNEKGRKTYEEFQNRIFKGFI